MPDPLGDFSYTWPFYVAPILGYFLGSIPFGLLLTRLAGIGDIRRIGSGNIGATNVLRTGSKPLALLTVFLDGGKGALSYFLANLLGPDMATLAAGGAFVGHLFPVWLKFKGGKGVATALGILLIASWPVGLLTCLIWVAVAILFRYSSVAALTATSSAPILAWFFEGGQLTELAIFMTVLIVSRHYCNILRLLKREETKININ